MNTSHSLSKEYLEHKIFEDLDYIMEFYDSLSMSIFTFLSLGTRVMCNIDTYSYSSMRGTLSSIKLTLKDGRINDAFSLLRKFHDSAIINVYSNLYLKNNLKLEDLIVEKINSWIEGKEKLPEFRIMSQYIRESSQLSELNSLLYKDNTYKKIRERCNDHTHYNFYHNVLLNDNEIYLENNLRIKSLNRFQQDLMNLFILHISYIFSLNDHYMMSSDYRDYMDMGIQPPEDSQYYVAPFVQDLYNKIIVPLRPDIYQLICTKTEMRLE